LDFFLIAQINASYRAQAPNQAFTMQHAFINKVNESNWVSTIQLSFFHVFMNVRE
jgi:hypothetical protein